MDSYVLIGLNWWCLIVTERSMRALRTFTAATAVGLIALVGIVHQASAQIKIGAVLSVSGPASFLGDPEKRTLEIYVDEINAKGGVNGQKLQLVVYDDGGNADNARTFATRLVEEDKIVAMVGGSTTGSTMAMIPVFEDAKIPFISLAGAIQIIQPVRPWVFKTPHTDKMACEKIFADLKARKLTTIGLISGTDAFGKSMRDQCVAVASTAKPEAKAFVTFLARPDFKPKLAAAGLDYKE